MLIILNRHFKAFTYILQQFLSQPLHIISNSNQGQITFQPFTALIREKLQFINHNSKDILYIFSHYLRNLHILQ